PSPYLRSDGSVSFLEFRHIRRVECKSVTRCIRGCDVPLVHIDADLSQCLHPYSLLREGDADRATSERDGAPLEGRVVDEGEMIVGTLEGEVDEVSRGGGDSQEQVIQRVALVVK